MISTAIDHRYLPAGRWGGGIYAVGPVVVAAGFLTLPARGGVIDFSACFYHLQRACGLHE